MHNPIDRAMMIITGVEIVDDPSSDPLFPLNSSLVLPVSMDGDGSSTRLPFASGDAVGATVDVVGIEEGCSDITGARDGLCVGDLVEGDSDGSVVG